ncbi:fumarylacetoacetase [Collibacillus ludicampi]|uniref:Fumarylacetoacetase n=1 Tax=Collibacillus ludicampi TaxID=2771369 RepID=A0AAV4LFB5_9BACL|nr:fumarylacetoacetate hydrolase family protein [Collibacillus ludicampi]GIM46550.1 fumarylacetoacetase [Collibacillus ludicampi]
MKWVTYCDQSKEKVGWIVELQDEEYMIPLEAAADWFRSQGRDSPPVFESLLSLIEAGEEVSLQWKEIHGSIQSKPEVILEIGVPIRNVKLLAPIPRPPSIRDFYAFEEHVKNARGRRGLEVIPEWYEIPVFYFSNHLAVVGTGESIRRPKLSRCLDYELELACVIGKKGRDIPAEKAADYIFGYMIMNDWSARDLQIKEMKVGLGPAKGKDFATSLGPYLVTPDELDRYKTANGRYRLEMKAYINGNEISSGNFETIYYTFAQMIERASADVTLYPGEILGSGTVGNGCLLELGEEVHRWLEPGDTVSLSVTGMGTLTNNIIE